ncbi:HipA N-terminal domain-containing protein [Paracoccus binzhouensis]|uniref:HipA N-terminal domain-containing protein n=1 Tax=Paracoccus binzhouensis TaxID=2796149 RepID=UPI0018EEEF25
MIVPIFHDRFDVAQLAVDGRGAVSLDYDPRWQAARGAFPISLTMPLSRRGQAHRTPRSRAEPLQSCRRWSWPFLLGISAIRSASERRRPSTRPRPPSAASSVLLIFFPCYFREGRTAHGWNIEDPEVAAARCRQQGCSATNERA